MWRDLPRTDHRRSRPNGRHTTRDRPMATTGSWVYQIAKERQEGWRREQWEHPETYRGPDATRDAAPMAAVRAGYRSTRPRPVVPRPAASPERVVARLTHAGSSDRCCRQALVERLAQVGEQVVDALDADGQPDERRIDLERRPRHRQVGHRGRQLDERLDATERLGQGEQPRALGDGDRPVRGAATVGAAVGRDERDHPAEARVGDPLDVLAVAQELGDRRGIRPVPFDAQVERAQAAQHQEAVERAGHRPHRVLQEAQALRDRVVRGDGHAQDRVGVAGEVLRRRVEHDVGAEGQRPLDGGRREGVVDDDAAAVDRPRRRAGRGWPRRPRCRRS